MVMGRTVVWRSDSGGLGRGRQNKPAVAKAPTPPTIATSGKQTYMQYCASCHGIDARGEGPAGIRTQNTAA